MKSSEKGVLRWLAEKPVVCLAAYYLILLAAAMVINRLEPALLARSAEPQGGGVETLLTEQYPPASVPHGAGEALLGMAVAFLLMAPVAWVYYLTRRTRGYQQSLMHTLVILPIVVAGVVILVKNSIALAFSLGGIVGAIAFRNRLQDTKDAVHVFVAIGVGLACGVEGLGIAYTLSIFYNAVNLALWMGDVGRLPPGLVGPPAAARLDALKSPASGSGAVLVSQIDSLLLKSMSRDQLDVLVQRADKRRRNLEEQIEGEVPGGKRKVRLRVAAPPDVLEAHRAEAESVLNRLMKEWQLAESSSANGQAVAVYEGRIKKKVDTANLQAELKAVLGEKAGKVEVEPAGGTA